MNKQRFAFRGKVWRYEGKAAWHFLTLSKSLAKRIEKVAQGQTRAWGSLGIEVEIDEVQWKTSLFPDKKSDSYLLPLKSQIRKRLGVQAGDTIRGYIVLEKESPFF